MQVSVDRQCHRGTDRVGLGLEPEKESTQCTNAYKVEPIEEIESFKEGEDNTGLDGCNSRNAKEDDCSHETNPEGCNPGIVFLDLSLKNCAICDNNACNN